MAKNQSRSMNGDFDQGTLDGTYKRVLANQANIVHDPDKHVRREMSWRFGFEEEVVASRPGDGKPVIMH